MFQVGNGFHPPRRYGDMTPTVIRVLLIGIVAHHDRPVVILQDEPPDRVADRQFLLLDVLDGVPSGGPVLGIVPRNKDQGIL